MLDTFLQDTRYAARVLRKHPGFTAAAVLTLAVGIGANVGVFSLVNALLFRTLPGVEAPERVVAIFTGDGSSFGVSSYMDFRDFEERVGAFEASAAYKPLLMDLTHDGDTARIGGLIVTGDYFAALGVRPVIGRLLGAEDDMEPNAHPVVALSWGLWQRQFAGDPDIVGREVVLNGRTFSVIGVAPRGFHGTSISSARAQLFAPMMMQPHFMPSSGNLLDRRGWGGVLLIGRLRDGAGLEQARAEVARVGDWLHETYPDQTGWREYGVLPLSQATLSPAMRGPVSRIGALLAAVSALVLLVACVNVANLLLARAAARQREIAVRQAVGAGRGRIARQLIIETVVLALLGGAAGLVLANAVLETVRLLPLDVPDRVGLDTRVLAFTLGVSLLAGMLFGVLPALRATRADLVRRLRDSGDLRGRERRRPAASMLVSAQVALSMVLMVIAGLFARTLVQLQTVELGFEPQGVAVMTVDPVLQGYDGAATGVFYRELLSRARTLPGAARVSLTSALPGPDADDYTSVFIEGVPDDDRPSVGYTVVGTQYFRTLGIGITRGRDFEDSDATSSTLVAVVNAAGAAALRERYDLEILDRNLSPQGTEGPRWRVVGVTADSKTGPPRADPAPMLYLLHSQLVALGMGAPMTVVARTDGDPAALAGQLRDLLVEVAPTVPAIGVGTLADHVTDSLEQERSVTAMVTVAALLSLLLALVGLYGVLSYAVSRRTGELGIRMALGARAGDVRRLVIRQGVGLASLGVVLGLTGALASSRLLGSFLFGVSGTDPLTYGGMAALLLAVAVVASWLPAHRATRVDPVIALRTE